MVGCNLGRVADTGGLHHFLQGIQRMLVKVVPASRLVRDDQTRDFWRCGSVVKDKPFNHIKAGIALLISRQST